MRFSLIRTAIAAMVTSVAAAACGGHALVPSQAGAPLNAFEPMKKSNPCYTSKVQPAWIFKGSCTTFTLPAKGGTFKLKPYMDVSVDITLPTNNGGNTSFALIDAIGGKADDIEKWKGKTFPHVTSKSLVYVEAVNGHNGLKFTNPKQYFIFSGSTKKSLPGKSCKLSILQKKSTGYVWFPSPLSGTIKGKTITFKIPATQVGVLFLNGIPKGPLYFNVGCSP